MGTKKLLGILLLLMFGVVIFGSLSAFTLPLIAQPVQGAGECLKDAGFGICVDTTLKNTDMSIKTSGNISSLYENSTYQCNATGSCWLAFNPADVSAAYNSSNLSYVTWAAWNITNASYAAINTTGWLNQFGYNGTKGQFNNITGNSINITGKGTFGSNYINDASNRSFLTDGEAELRLFDFAADNAGMVYDSSHWGRTDRIAFGDQYAVLTGYNYGSGGEYYQFSFGDSVTSGYFYSYDTGGSPTFEVGLASTTEALFADDDSGNSVYLADTTYAINAVGNSLFTGKITATGNITAPWFNGFLNDTRIMPYSSWNSTNISYALNTTLSKMAWNQTNTTYPAINTTGWLNEKGYNGSWGQFQTISSIGVVTTDGLTLTGRISQTGITGAASSTGSIVFLAAGAGGTGSAGNGGQGGYITLIAASGGTGTKSSTTVTGGRATKVSSSGASGGTAIGSGTCTLATGGAGTSVEFYSGAGGDARNSNTVSTGGAAGNIILSGYTGGASTTASGTIHTGGKGSDVTLTGGTGGAASGGSASNTGGAGGTLTYTAGIGGTGTTANGANGNIIFKSGATEIARFDNTAGAVGNLLLAVGNYSFTNGWKIQNTTGNLTFWNSTSPTMCLDWATGTLWVEGCSRKV